MTVCSKPKSFMGLGYLTASAYSSNSLNSMCSSNCNENSNTTTSNSSLSLPSLPSEEEDWRQFGYLLDCENFPDVDSTVPYYQQYYEPPVFMRSNSSPAAAAAAAQANKESSELEISSLDVEISSDSDLEPSSSSTCSQKRSNSISSNSERGDEPVAKRTRNNLANRDALRECLGNLRDVPKDEMISKFLQSTPKPAAKVRVHNVCRPWWHKKILENSINSAKIKSENESDVENKYECEAIRKPKEAVADAILDPRFISLGGNSTQTKETETKDPQTMKKTEVQFMKQEMEDLKSCEDTSTHGKHKLDVCDKRKGRRGQALSPLADDEKPMGGKTGKNRKRSIVNSTIESQRNSIHPPTRKNKRQHKIIQSTEADDESDSSTLDPTKKHCSCGTPYDPKKFYLRCDRCKSWFHGKCVGITEKKAQKMETWTCSECEKQKTSRVELYCVCRQPYDEAKFYVGCDSCEDWFHPECIGTSQQEVSKFDEFICPKCRGSWR